MSDTPRTTALLNEILADRAMSGCIPKSFAMQLERELSTVTKQRDELAEIVKLITTAMWNSPKVNAETLIGYPFLMVRAEMALKDLKESK